MSADGGPISLTAAFALFSDFCSLTDNNVGTAPEACSQGSGLTGNSPLILSGYQNEKSEKDNQKQSRNFKIFPNPAEHSVNIDLKQFRGQEIDVAIYNPLGKVFFKQHFDNLEKELLRVDLDAAKFRDGMYFVSVIRQGKVISKRLVVTHSGGQVKF